MPRPVVILPGYYGSILYDTLAREVVWLDGNTILHGSDTLDAIRLDTGSPDRIVPTGILEEVYIFPFLTPDVYKVLVKLLREQCNLPDEWIYRFGIDWRKSITTSAADLDRRITGHLARTGQNKVVLIAHSHGGLVARAYLAKYGMDKVERLITLGTPHKGMLKTMEAVVSGISFLLFSKSQLRDVARTFPSAFELLPSNSKDGLFQSNGKNASPFTSTAWCPPGCATLLGGAETVLGGLPLDPGVPSTFIYGTHLDTLTSASMNGSFSVQESSDGDGTVPRVSAMGQGLADKIDRCAVPFANHGMMFANPFVQSIVKDILLDRTTETRFTWGFDQGPLIKPGRTNTLAIELRDKTGAAVEKATVKVAFPSQRVKPQQLSQTPQGDYVVTFRNPPAGQHLQYEITASAPSITDQAARGVLFTGNH